MITPRDKQLSFHIYCMITKLHRSAYDEYLKACQDFNKYISCLDIYDKQTHKQYCDDAADIMEEFADFLDSLDKQEQKAKLTER